MGNILYSGLNGRTSATTINKYLNGSGVHKSRTVVRIRVEQQFAKFRLIYRKACTLWLRTKEKIVIQMGDLHKIFTIGNGFIHDRL